MEEKNKNHKNLIIIAGVVIGIVVIIGVFLLGRASNVNNPPYEYNTEDGTTKNTGNGNNNKSQGKIYERISLNDKGVNMFNSIVPKGWTATISSQNLVNSSYPFVETVVIENPDKTAKITILSQHSYTENSKFNEGENQDYYTTYLHTMDASTYSDYFMDRIFKGSTFVKENQVDDKIVEELKALQADRVNLANQDANTIGAGNYGVTFSIGDEGYTTSKKEYKNGDITYETSTSVLAISTNLTSSLSRMLDSRAIQWYIPYLIVYEANTKENYEKYYDDYNFIVANSTFTKDYYAMVEYVSSAIVNAYTSYYAAKSQAALDAMNNYIDSNYSSTSSSSTQDKVREMWDDVIKEQDKYTLEDGSTIKTSIHNDTVAQNGDEIYIGTKAGIPFGFNELSKGY